MTHIVLHERETRQEDTYLLSLGLCYIHSKVLQSD